MSGTSTVVSRELYDYVAARAHAEDPFLLELKRAAEEAEIPAIWISPEQGAFMEVLLRAAQPHLVVEVGTLAGYSAICMARALSETGRLITMEVSSKHADFARAAVGDLLTTSVRRFMRSSTRWASARRRMGSCAC